MQTHFTQMRKLAMNYSHKKLSITVSTLLLILGSHSIMAMGIDPEAIPFDAYDPSIDTAID